MRTFLALLLSTLICIVAPAQKSRQQNNQRAKQRTTQKTTKRTTQRKQNTTTTKTKKAKQPSEREILQNNQRVKQQMQDVMVLGNAIDDKKRLIDTIQTDIDSLTQDLTRLNNEMDSLKKELVTRQNRYVHSVRFMHRNRRQNKQMTFFFSAKNINQMYRRVRFMNQYATYQKAQGEAVKIKQMLVEEKQRQIDSTKTEKSNKLEQGRIEQENLEKQQEEHKRMVTQLQKEQYRVQQLIQKEQEQEAELNKRIEKLIAEEIAREKARIEAEKKRKAEELARKERERKERERRLAEARAMEEKAKAEAKAAKTAREKEQAQQRAKDAENVRKTAERDVETSKKEINAFASSDFDKKLTGSFVSNKGKLPMPITGPYRILRTFGSNIVEGLGNVHLSSKGLHLQGQAGAKVRSIYDGQVSKIYWTGTSYIVMVRHGQYISVYCDIASVSVKNGQKISTSQTLGSLGSSNTMQFQLRNQTALLNPLLWLRR